MQLFTKEMNEREMAGFAARLAPLLATGDCLLFHGDLGAGKTSFIRAAIQALCGIGEVPSPTYTLLQHYPCRHGGKEITLWHFDLYRLKAAEELYELGFEDAQGGVMFIEWPQRAAALLPRDALALHFGIGQQGATRHIKIEGSPIWAERLKTLW